MAGKSIHATCRAHHQCNAVYDEDSGLTTHVWAPDGPRLEEVPAWWNLRRTRERRRLMRERGW